MSIITILGYLGAVLTGLVLGLLGGGGAALSIPILKYAFDVSPEVATGYSLLIVGSTALLGTIQNLRLGFVKYRALLYCGLPAVISMYVMRRYLIHSIPTVFLTIGGHQLTKDTSILLLLAFFMAMVARNMIFAARPGKKETRKSNYILVLLESMFIGLFMGTVGGGGGFLLTPLILASEPMEFRNATATALTVVTLNSFIGFLGDVLSNAHRHQLSHHIDWPLLLGFLACSILGMFIGLQTAHKVDNKKLRLMFGYTMLGIAIFIIGKELLLKLF
jgi:uncharacterized membrane protein YfcA